MQQSGSPQRLGGISAQQGGGAVPLSVVMGPQRARTTISFQPREGLSNSSSQRPTLTVFAHEPGSRVHKDLFPVYRMPNGQLAFMYYTAGRVQVPGPPPSALAAAWQPRHTVPRGSCTSNCTQTCADSGECAVVIAPPVVTVGERATSEHVTAAQFPRVFVFP